MGYGNTGYKIRNDQGHIYSVYHKSTLMNEVINLPGAWNSLPNSIGTPQNYFVVIKNPDYPNANSNDVAGDICFPRDNTSPQDITNLYAFPGLDRIAFRW